MILSSIWCDGMILQRHKPIYIQGYARRKDVIISFADKNYRIQAKEKGYFELSMEALEAGGPYEMVLYDGERTVISDIWIGDVWVLGGQSNMELPIHRTLEYSKNEIEGISVQNHIRMFQVPQGYDFKKQQDSYTSGEWITVTNQTIRHFSAVGYFFARELYAAQGVSIGLVHTAVGGTPIEAWMQEETLKHLGVFEEETEKLKEEAYVNKIIALDTKRIATWNDELDKKDKGIQEKWYTDFWKLETIKKLKLPGFWFEAELEMHRGSVWLQKEIEVPEHWAGKEVELNLGAFVDRDETYVNGILVGHTDYRYPPRNYRIPPLVLVPGKNQITVRIISDARQGGAVEGKCYALSYKKETIFLEGDWKYRIGATMEELLGQTFFQYKPTGVFNHMICPLSKFGIKGVAFYQGESNTEYPEHYKKLFGELVKDWRNIFKQGEIPFVYVQLANYGDNKNLNKGFNWAVLREQQRKCLEFPNVAMVVTWDIGEYNDLHPQNKVEVGRRLALAARQLAYEECIVSEGPTLESLEINEETISICFGKCEKEIVIKEEGSIRMMILWEDGIEEYAIFKKDKNRLVTPRRKKQLPLRIRYAWANNPQEIGVYNEQGLLSSPFEIGWDKSQNKYVF